MNLLTCVNELFANVSLKLNKAKNHLLRRSNRKWALHDIMFRPALESVKKGEKIALATRNEYVDMAFHFRSESAGSGESKIRWCAPLTSKDGVQEP